MSEASGEKPSLLPPPPGDEAPDPPYSGTSEGQRVAEAGDIQLGPEEAGPWYEWGPYVSERAWGTVREDYSDNGDAWSYFPYNQSMSRAYRWSEDGLAGISTIWQDLCFGIAVWNGKDPHIKERLFGLSGPEGNHGEDVKEYYWYRDATPSHSWLSWRYHYPQQSFPYDDLVATNASRTRAEREYELIDTGIFDEDRYWTIDVDYAKNDPTDIYIRIRATNNGPDPARLDVLGQLWFRDTWSWGRRHRRPEARLVRRPNGSSTIVADHWRAGTYHLDAAQGPDGQYPQALFCDNTSNTEKLWGYTADHGGHYFKDGINDHLVAGSPTVNPEQLGTKAAHWYRFEAGPGETAEVRLRLWSPSAGDTADPGWAGADHEAIMAVRESEADEFYCAITPDGRTPDEALVLRQAFAGMIWSKQFYRYDVKLWLDGDPLEPAPPPGHKHVRNTSWRHVDAYDVLSMPDSWEYPWFAAWDLAFHTVVFAHIDPEFAKYQLSVMLREWYMHPNGAIPAYEWSFDDRNPPVHAWAALRVYEIDGSRDNVFLATVFQKLLINFTWWVNRVDPRGNNVFQGGFLGLDNIGPIDRTHVPPDSHLNQADGTAWMAFYCLMMLRMALRLSKHDDAYRPMILKFLEHFAGICDGITEAGLWDPEDGFFYDQLVTDSGQSRPLRVKSIVGLIPVLAATYIDSGNDSYLKHARRLERRFSQFVRRRGLDTPDPNRAGFVYRTDEASGSKLLLTVVDPDRLRLVLVEMLSEDSFLSPFGIRSLSKIHHEHPFSIEVDGETFMVDYEPAESRTEMYGGNSNWRGPVWFPINHLIIEALERYHLYLGADFTVECPTGSGRMMNLQEVAHELRRRLISLFLPDQEGHRPALGDSPIFRGDPRWNSDVLFHEYFNGETGEGIGASHQTGWTGLVADLIIGRRG